MFSPAPEIIAGHGGALLLWALILDAALGGRGALGRIPGPDGLISVLIGVFAPRLDRISRSSRTRRARGAVFTVLLAVFGYAAGYLFEAHMTGSVAGTVLEVLVLTLLFGQRYAFDTARQLARRLEADDHSPSEGRHGAARWSVELLANRFADGFIANLLVYGLFGLGGLFAFRVLSDMTAHGAPKGVALPTTPFFRPAAQIYRWISLPAGLMAALVIRLGGLVVPRGPSLRRRSGGFPAIWPGGTVPLRLWAVGGFAVVLGLALKAEPDGDGAMTTTTWIGPGDGRARAGPVDIRRAAYLFVACWLIGLLILSAATLVSL